MKPHVSIQCGGSLLSTRLEDTAGVHPISVLKFTKNEVDGAREFVTYGVRHDCHLYIFTVIYSYYKTRRACKIGITATVDTTAHITLNLNFNLNPIEPL